MQGYFVLVAAFLAPLALDPWCSPEAWNNLQRSVEGGADREERVLIAEEIESLRADLGGTSSTSLAERMAALGVPGVGVGVVDGGRVVWTQGFGVRNAPGDPATSTTLFQAGSISKAVTAVAALQLVENGVWSLDAPVDPILESWHIPQNEFTQAAPVTLRGILTHTAGFNVDGFIGYYKPPTLPTLVQILDGQQPANSPPIRVIQTPGSGFLYSGGGMTVLQQMLVDTRGDFAEHLRIALLERAGMFHSSFLQPLPPEVLSRAATGRFLSSFIPEDGKANTYPELAAAGLWTTAADLARFVAALQRSLTGEEDALLGTLMAAEMMRPQGPNPGTAAVGNLASSAAMGLGIFLFPAESPRWFVHTGGTAGFQAVMIGSLEGGLGAVVLTNRFPGGTQLGFEIIEGVAALRSWPDWE